MFIKAFTTEEHNFGLYLLFCHVAHTILRLTCTIAPPPDLQARPIFNGHIARFGIK